MYKTTAWHWRISNIGVIILERRNHRRLVPHPTWLFLKGSFYTQMCVIEPKKKLAVLQVWGTLKANFLREKFRKKKSPERDKHIPHWTKPKLHTSQVELHKPRKKWQLESHKADHRYRQHAALRKQRLQFKSYQRGGAPVNITKLYPSLQRGHALGVGKTGKE